MDERTGTVAVGSARLAHVVRGARDAPAVVLLHAGVTDQRAWDACARALAADRRVVTHDRRGFGASTWEAEAFSHVDDLLAVMDALAVDRATLVGSSQGGRVALEAALAVPARVDGLVLLAPAVGGAPMPDDDDLDPALIALDDAIMAAEEAGDLERVNELEAHMWLDGPLEEAGRVRGEARRRFLAMNGVALAAPEVGEVSWPTGPPAWERLGELAVPTHVVSGALDASYVVDRGRAVAAAIPDATHTLLDGTAHLPMLEHPEAVVAAIRVVTG